MRAFVTQKILKGRSILARVAKLVSVPLHVGVAGGASKTESGRDDLSLMVKRQQEVDAVHIVPVQIRPGLYAGAVGERYGSAVGRPDVTTKPEGLPGVLGQVLPPLC